MHLRHLCVAITRCLTLVLFFLGAARVQAQQADVRAQEAVSASGPRKMRFALFQPAALDAALSTLAHRLDPVLLTQVTAIGGVEVAAQPSLDLPAMQLAIDCVGEVVECMRAVTTQAEVEGLIAPVLQTSGAETVLTLLYFDVYEGVIRGATRRHTGPRAEEQTLDAVPEMLRELFRVEAPARAAPREEEVLKSTSEPPREPERVRSLPVVPLVLGAVGVVLIGTGIGLGVSASKSEDSYAKAPVMTRAQIDAADREFDAAKNKALWSNVTLATGGAAVAAGLFVWLFTRHRAHSGDQGARELSLAPTVGRGIVAVSARGRFVLP